MLSKKIINKNSIRNKFILQLVVASAALIVIFSTILFNYIKISIYEDIANDLQKTARFFSNSIRYNKGDIDIFRPDENIPNAKISVVIRPDLPLRVSYEQFSLNKRHYIKLYYPLDIKKFTFVTVTRDVSSTDILLEKILKNIFIINMITMVFIIFYALFLSQILLNPIRSLTLRLSRLNENFLTHIDIDDLPSEFMPLGVSINKLIDRIKTFVKYQKELFIGIAHELKTPLAVMKTKNEVTLIKKREPEKYIETLKLDNKTIDEMNKMISNILEIGRQEGAQFEKPVDLDLIAFIKEHANNFKLLARHENKDIIINLKPESYVIKTQSTLLLHILQNFVQNAIKFTPEGKTVEIRTYNNENGFYIEIVDEGPGIDENKDLFAPFKRFGDKSGTGLGLFLAKGAADAIGATISLKNREDKKGSVATIFLPFVNFCEIT